MFRRRSIPCCTEQVEESVLILIIILLSIVMIWVTWSTCRPTRRRRASDSCESSQPPDAFLWSPCLVTVSTIKETEFSQSHCVVCGTYHSTESTVSNNQASDAEKGMTNVCAIGPPPPVYVPTLPGYWPPI